MPKTPTAAASISEPAPPKRRSSRYATKIIHMTSVIVRRASHCHQTPQALRAQSGPGDEHDDAEHHGELRGGERDVVGQSACGATR